MYSNHHAKRLVSLKGEIIKINADIQNLRADLEWFERFDQESNHSRLAQLQRETRRAGAACKGRTEHQGQPR